MISLIFGMMLVMSDIFETVYDGVVAASPYVKEYSIKTVAFVITVSIITYDVIRYVIDNNEMIRDKIGSYFVYTSPSVRVV